ncbi:MAG: caspase family protein, partial [SAR324 cluster bacterium]|nr:caspase family protein [SAR324 cluster bacterium]
MKKTILLLFCVSLLPIITYGQERSVKRKGQTGLRFALVIGNSNYQQTSKLRNPVNDAKAINKTLRELGFTVTALENADQRKMENAIRKFGKKLRTDQAVGLFYYAGHGMQIDGENYLLPVEANPSNEDDVRYDGVPVGKLLGQMKNAGNSMNIVILDACRNNPFTRNFRSSRRGLAQVTAPAGTFISYATAPGSVAADGEGKNGLFTEKLISHMRTPGLKLEEVFKKVRADVQLASDNKQVPWDASSVTGDFYFASLEKTGSQNYVLNKTAGSIPTVEAPPETSGLQLKELTQLAKSQEKAKEKLKEAKKQWSAWQSRMQKDFNAAQNFESRDITPDLKIEPWRQFLEAYASNNPFGKKDENLRSKAMRQLEYWRSENVRLSKKNIAQSSSTASVEISNTPEISAPPTNPDADKIWKKYQLGLKRNLPKIAEKYLQKLLSEHPESNYAIKIRVEELNAQLDKNGLRGGLIDKIEEIRAKHPRNPDLRKLIVQARPFLLRGIDRFIEGGSLDFAEQALSFAARWNVPGTELSRRRQKIKQIRISSLIKDADLRIKQGN